MSVKVTTLIPTYRNDGSQVDEFEMHGIIRRFWNQFGGATIEGIVEGHWVDSQSGQHFQDASKKLFVVVTDDRVDEVEALVIEIGKQLGQLAMYFEVTAADIRILDTH